MAFRKTGPKGLLAMLAAVFVPAVAAVPVFAATEYCSQSRPSGVAEIVGNGRAYFHNDADMCSNRGRYCLARAYALTGDRVLTSVSQDGYICVFMLGREQTTAGWIETRRLQPRSFTLSPAFSAWTGDWRSEDVAKITVSSKKGGALAVGSDDWANGDGREHHAEFSGQLRTNGNSARLEDGLCKVSFILIAEFMVVEDDNSCGDGNTSFRGIYRKLHNKAR